MRCDYVPFLKCLVRLFEMQIYKYYESCFTILKTNEMVCNLMDM